MCCGLGRLLAEPQAARLRILRKSPEHKPFACWPRIRFGQRRESVRRNISAMRPANRLTYGNSKIRDGQPVSTESAGTQTAQSQNKLRKHRRRIDRLPRQLEFRPRLNRMGRFLRRRTSSPEKPADALSGSNVTAASQTSHHQFSGGDAGR